jgi:hypothetical protein
MKRGSGIKSDWNEGPCGVFEGIETFRPFQLRDTENVYYEETKRELKEIEGKR